MPIKDKNVFQLTISSDTNPAPVSAAAAAAAAVTAPSIQQTKPKLRPPPIQVNAPSTESANMATTTTKNQASSNQISANNNSSNAEINSNTGKEAKLIQMLSQMDISSEQKDELKKFLRSREEIGDLANDDLAVEGELGSGNGGVVLKVHKHNYMCFFLFKRLVKINSRLTHTHIYSGTTPQGQHRDGEEADPLGGEASDPRSDFTRAHRSARLQLALHRGLLRRLHQRRRDQHLHAVHGRWLAGPGAPQGEPHTGAYSGQDHRGRPQGSKLSARESSDHAQGCEAIQYSHQLERRDKAVRFWSQWTAH